MDRTDLHPYQRYAVDFIKDHEHCGLFLDMGLGKTVSALTAVSDMIDGFDILKVLVIAPKRVAEDTWTREALKWEHLKNLRISKVLGSADERRAALSKEADVYVINRENTVWLVKELKGRMPFDMLVIDELSSFKSAKAQRFKALKYVRSQFSRIVGLTGTPAPNGYMDLWSEMYLIDGGERLEKSIGRYRDKYFVPGRRNGMVIFDYRLIFKKDLEITKKISDICISMKAKDYITLPSRIDITTYVTLTEDEKRRYDKFEKDETLRLYDSTKTITAANAAALSTKLLQYANGAVYDDDRTVHEIHDRKLEALEELIEEANGKPVLVFYEFRHDASRIKRYLKNYEPHELTATRDIDEWNDGRTRVLLAHPASAGHGLNLQQGGSIVIWFGVTWSLEQYEQANARLYRQGQTRPVTVYHLVTEGTMDEDVMKAIAGKADTQRALMDSVKARIRNHTC